VCNDLVECYPPTESFLLMPVNLSGVTDGLTSLPHNSSYVVRSEKAFSEMKFSTMSGMHLKRIIRGEIVRQTSILKINVGDIIRGSTMLIGTG